MSIEEVNMTSEELQFADKKVMESQRDSKNFKKRSY